jgi:hypothetical protein
MRTFTDVLIDIGAGSVGGAVGCVVGHPLDTVKVRMQRYAQSSMIQCTKLTYAGEGIMGFYKGILPPLVSISLYQVTIHLNFYSVLYKSNTLSFVKSWHSCPNFFSQHSITTTGSMLCQLFCCPSNGYFPARR